MKNIINVDVIRPRSLRAIIGPSGTLRRIIENRPFFINRGYNIEIFTHDNIYYGTNLPPVNKIQKNKKTIIHSAKTKLRSLAKRSYLLGIFYITIDYYKVKKLVDYYFTLNRNPDIVAFHSTFECYQFLKRNTNKCKTVCFFHSDGVPFKMQLYWFPKLKNTRFFKKLYKMEEYVAEHADRLIFITNVGQTNFLKYYPNIEKDKTSVILNGIDDLSKEQIDEIDEVAAWTDAKYHICCVGTITPRKGQRIIIEALGNMDKELRTDVHVTFIGEGPERMALEDYAKRNSFFDNITFMGAIDNREVYKYLYRANIFILMSNNEGLPISIIEAMRQGLPIISTNVAGIPELVAEGKNGLLIEPKTEQLSKIFNNLHKYDWKSMGTYSRERFEKEFTFDRMKTEYCDVLDSLYR